MKKYVLGLVVLTFSVLSFADCSTTEGASIYSKIQSLQSAWGFSGEYSTTTENFLRKTLNNQQLIQTAGSAPIQEAQNKLLAYQEYGSLYQQYNSALLQSTSCKAGLSDLLDKGYNSEKNGQYQDAIDYYKKYLNGNSDTNSEGYKFVKGGLVVCYLKLAYYYENKEDRVKSIELNKEVLALDPSNYLASLSIALQYSYLGKLDDALIYYQKAYDAAKTKDNIDTAKLGLDSTKKEIGRLSSKKNAPSNDPLSYQQYYLKALNVPVAWNKVTNSNEVIVAIIDDGVSINHPDLGGKIWVKSNAVYGASKIIDFVGDKIGDNKPTGEHGTMIAGIIGASINNNEGIAGIAKNVKFMPLRVFGFDESAKEENIIRALNFAVDNGANIINLSLGGSQFKYSDKYDSVIKRAYDKGIIVVIAAGNGDILSSQETGIDLKVNPISPVCNNKGSTDYSIGVAAWDIEGYRTNWTNYNACVFLFAPGVDIISTSIPHYSGENYSTSDGTSFAAPMITGIIALGYNQYGFVSPKIVQESLDESATKSSVGNYQVDASKYLDALASRLTTIQREQKGHNAQVTSQNTIDSNSDGNVLASFGIVKQQDSEEAYNLQSNVLRQEVIGMAMKLGKYDLPEDYKCRRVFKDVSSTKPNSWVCRAVEIGVDHGIVSSTNKSFNPESSITRAEALAILMKAAGISIDESDAPSNYGDVTIAWQVNLVNSAFSYSFIDEADNFYPNNKATRSEIFNIAKRILEYKN